MDLRLLRCEAGRAKRKYFALLKQKGDAQDIMEAKRHWNLLSTRCRSAANALKSNGCLEWQAFPEQMHEFDVNPWFFNNPVFSTPLPSGQIYPPLQYTGWFGVGETNIASGTNYGQGDDCETQNEDSGSVQLCLSDWLSENRPLPRLEILKEALSPVDKLPDSVMPQENRLDRKPGPQPPQDKMPPPLPLHDEKKFPEEFTSIADCNFIATRSPSMDRKTTFSSTD